MCLGKPSAFMMSRITAEKSICTATSVLWAETEDASKCIVRTNENENKSASAQQPSQGPHEHLL